MTVRRAESVELDGLAVLWQHGWQDVVSRLDTPDRVFSLDVWRFEKRVG